MNGITRGWNYNGKGSIACHLVALMYNVREITVNYYKERACLLAISADRYYRPVIEPTGNKTSE